MMDMNNPGVLKAYAEGYRDGYALGYKTAKEDDVRLLKAGLCEEPDPGFGDKV